MTPNQVRGLMSLILLASYDRKVEREFFASLLDLCAETNIVLTDLTCGGRMADVLAKIEPEREPSLLNEEIDGHVAKWVANRKRLAEKFRLVMMCPTAADSIS